MEDSIDDGGIGINRIRPFAARVAAWVVARAAAEAAAEAATCGAAYDAACDAAARAATWDAENKLLTDMVMTKFETQCADGGKR